MKQEIIDIKAEGPVIIFTLMVTEPTTGETNTKEGRVYLSSNVENATTEELIDIVLASEDYQRFLPQVTTPLLMAMTKAASGKPQGNPDVPFDPVDMKMRWYDSVDTTVAAICVKFTRFQMGYEAREAAALAYRARGYTGDPTEWVTRFADNTGMDYKDATDRILFQATLFRTALKDLESLRMDKYLILQAPDMAAAQAAYDKIIRECFVINGKLV